jgi:RimJ/RimL family protein N-acetyltransferase
MNFKLEKTESVIIETERLILRRPDPEHDFDGWAKAMADEDTVRYLGKKTMNRAEAWRNMAMLIGHWSIRGYGPFSLQLKATGEWVGKVGPWYPEGWPEHEIGWTISPDHLRRGYAIEAARAAVDYAFNVLGWPRLIHLILEGNEASVALAKKLGSTFERVQEGLPGIMDQKIMVYGQRKS